MKKIVLAGLILLTSAAFAANTGTLVISGVVTAVNDLLIAPTPEATTLNITGGETGRLVAAVQETSNSLTGYNIKMRSANASKLVHGTDPSKSTAYTISYDSGAAVSLTTSDQIVKNISSLTGLTTVSSNVNVNVTAYPLAPAGTYSDTITISIAAN